jgi:hypothetical protein
MKIKHGPQEIEVDPVEVIKAEEPWCEYVLADGTKIKVKHVLGAVFRAKEVYIDTEEPLYVVRSQNVVMATEVPEELKRKG